MRLLALAPPSPLWSWALLPSSVTRRARLGDPRSRRTWRGQAPWSPRCRVGAEPVFWGQTTGRTGGRHRCRRSRKGHQVDRRSQLQVPFGASELDHSLQAKDLIVLEMVIQNQYSRRSVGPGFTWSDWTRRDSFDGHLKDPSASPTSQGPHRPPSKPHAGASAGASAGPHGVLRAAVATRLWGTYSQKGLR